MIELACANCHKTGGLWRAVTIEADAWQDITASLTEDGKLTKELGPIQDVGSYGSEISSKPIPASDGSDRGRRP